MIQCHGSSISFFLDLSLFVGHVAVSPVTEGTFFWKLVHGVLWLCLENSRGPGVRGSWDSVSLMLPLMGMGPKEEFVKSAQLGHCPGGQEPTVGEEGEQSSGRRLP